MSTSITGPGQAAGSGYRLEAENEARPQRRGETRAAPTPTPSRSTLDRCTLGRSAPGQSVNATAGGAGAWRRWSWPLRCRPRWLAATCTATASDQQYVTQFRVSVRHQLPLRIDPAGSAAPGDSLAGAGGSSAMLEMINDSQIVVQYLKSRQIVDDLAAAGVDLAAIYARNGADPVRTPAP